MTSSAIAALNAHSVPVILLEPGGAVVAWNPTCAETTGRELDEVRGVRFWELLAVPEEAIRCRAAIDVRHTSSEQVVVHNRTDHERVHPPADLHAHGIAFGQTKLLRGDAAEDCLAGLQPLAHQHLVDRGQIPGQDDAIGKVSHDAQSRQSA